MDIETVNMKSLKGIALGSGVGRPRFFYARRELHIYSVIVNATHSFKFEVRNRWRTIPIPTGGNGRVPGHIFGSAREEIPIDDRYIYVAGHQAIYPLRRKGSVYGVGYAFTIETPGGP